MRLRLIWLGLSVVTSLVLLLVGNLHIRQDFMGLAADRIRFNHQVLEEKIRDFEKLQAPLLETVARHPLLKEYVHDEDMNAAPLHALFSDLVSSNPVIMQLRYIDLLGNERLRIDRLRDGSIVTTPESGLQNKAHRDYFKHFSSLKPGEISFSDFDLNVENKMVEKPFNPTLRAATPVAFDGITEGIVVINYYMKLWLTEFAHFDQGSIALVDREGYFLLHPDEAWAWSRYTSPQRKAEAFYGLPIDLNSQEYRQIDSVTFSLPINFFGKELLTFYTLAESPDAVFFRKLLELVLIVLVVFIITVTPVISIIRFYIIRLNQARLEAEQAEAYLSSMFNNTFDAIITIGEDGIIQKANTVTVKLFGYTQEELTGNNVNLLIPPPHHDKHDGYIRAHDRSVTSNVLGQERDLFGRHKDGRLIPVSLAVTQVTINDRLHFIGTVRDISQESQSRRLFENVFSKAPMGIALVMPNGSFWQTNDAFCEILGYSPDELRKLSYQKITHPDDLESNMAMVQRVADNEIGSFTVEKRYITKQGESVWVNLTVSALFLDKEHKNLEYIIAMIEDISERKTMTEELQKTKEGLVEAERVAQIGHWDWQVATNTLLWSEGMMNLVEEDPARFRPDYDGFLTYVHPDDRNGFKDAVNASLLEHRPLDIYYRILTASGSEKIIHAKGKTAYAGDKAVRLFGTCQDVTEIKQLQEREQEQERMLLQQSKLAAMGEMIGAIAHQWRQPLNSIGLIMQDLVSAYKHNDLDEAYFKECQDDMMEQLHYMSNTIDEFRNFFTQSQQKISCNILNLIKEVYGLYWAQAKAHNITISSWCTPQEGELVTCEESDTERIDLVIENYASEIKQVILNLISNAKEAIENIETPLPQQQEIMMVLSSTADAVTLEIRDLAGGIPEAVKPRIFEPYYTTKEMGTGLGLYIVKTLVNERLKGHLEFTDREEEVDGEMLRGTTFRLILPREIPA